MSHVCIKKATVPSPQITDPSHFSAKLVKSWNDVCLKNYTTTLTHNLLTPFQSGFVPGNSTTLQLIHTYHTFCEAVDSGKEVRVVFCDICKVLDRVWHRGLLHKLSQMGWCESILKWFSSYLTERRQRVVINGQASQWTFVKAGVP